MHLNLHELKLVRNVLLARRAYAPTEIPLGASPWEDWMQPFLDRVNSEIRVQEYE